MPFLSLLDDRAKPKGSRDPLGFELVWTHHGRRVIGNLTTITASINNFAVAMLGFYWIHELYTHLPGSERPFRLRESFLRYEQLTGYLRYMGDDREIMGITRVSSRINDSKHRITFGMGTDQQILSDQASYGLWGLYSAAMRDTGLVKGDEREPTSIGVEIARDIQKKLDKVRLIELLKSDKKISRDDLQEQAKPFVSAIRNKKMQQQLLHALMNGNDRNFIQHELWRTTQAMAEQTPRLDDLPSFVHILKQRTENKDLQKRLSDIENMERLLVSANNLFHYCRRKDGEHINTIVETLEGRYDYTHFSKTLNLDGVPRAELLIAIRNALLQQDNREAVHRILELNKIVMEQRGGAPWVELERNGTLRVRVPHEKAELKGQPELVTAWDYEYFLSSYMKIASKALGTQWTA